MSTVTVAKSYRLRNSESLVSFRPRRRYLPDMDARSTRTANLRRLVAELGLENVAQKAETSAKTLQQILAGTPLPSGKPRGLGHNLARRIEANCGKPHGWLDIAHDATLFPEALALLDLIRDAASSGSLTAQQCRAVYDVTRSIVNAH
jgi:hypothetical protein